MNIIKEWGSAGEASLGLDISKSKIRECLKGRQNQTGGFIFKYK